MGVCGRAATRRPAPSGASPIGFSHHPPRPANGQPIVAGWLSHWVAQVRLTSESWTAPLSIVRVPPGAKLNEVAVAQIQRVLARRPADDRRPLCVFDAGDDAVQLAHGRRLADRGTRATSLVRRRRGRCFYAAPPPYTGTANRRGRRNGGPPAP